MAAGGDNGPLWLYSTLFKIARELDKKDELAGMKFLCTGIISRSMLEQINKPLDLFTELTKSSRITETDFSFLEKLLSRKDGIGREDLLALLTTELQEQNIQQIPPPQSSPTSQYPQQAKTSTTTPPYQRQHQPQQANLPPNHNNAADQKVAQVPNLQTRPPQALPPLLVSSPQHADAPQSPPSLLGTSASAPGVSGPHTGPRFGPSAGALGPQDTVPKSHFPTSSYQTPPKRLLRHGEEQSSPVGGKATTMQEMREQWEGAAHDQSPGRISTPPKQLYHGSDTVGSLDKVPTLTEFQQQARDATDASNRMKHQQERVQSEGKATSLAEMQEQLAVQPRFQDTVGSLDKTTSLAEMQQQLQQIAPVVPGQIRQGAALSDRSDLQLMEINRQWEEKQAAALQGTPSWVNSGALYRSSTPAHSSPPQGLDDDVVQDSPSSMQDVEEATSPLEYKTVHNVPYHSPSSISNVGQSPVLGANMSDDLEVDSPTRPEEPETPQQGRQYVEGSDSETASANLAYSFSRLNMQESNRSVTPPLPRVAASSSYDRARVDAGPAVRPKVRPEDPLSPEADEGSTPIRQDVLLPENMPGTQNAEGVNLREYQKELAQSALRGKNVIITCATGSGKTLVSALTAKSAWSKAKERGVPFKALFIVPIRNLTKQQKDQYEMLFPRGVVQEIGDTESLSETLRKRDIVMLTAQIVVNSLKGGSLDFTTLDLLIFDECHHTTLDHPYNQIMRYYKEKKEELEKANRGGAAAQKRLPQVIGLTASLGVGGGDALKHLIELCAALDASRVDHVKENREELRRHVFTPEAVHILSGQPRRLHDPFSTAIDSLMQRMESKVFTDTCPYDRGTQQCENWIVEKLKKAEATSMRKELIVAQYLFHFNRALRLFHKLRAVDAISYLDEKIFESPEQLKGPPRLPIDKFCFEQYNGIRDELGVYAEEEETKFPNPMLQQLRSILIEKFNEPESYGIVLTQQRRETEAIINYVEEQEVLFGKMRAKRLVGQGKLEDKAITDAQQMAVLKSFRKGLKSEDGCNLLVATDVAQEGLDMPKCNFVIRYDFVSNEIGSVQARGRARAKDAECYLLVTAGSNNEKRELENQEKEKFMVEALQKMDELTQVDFEMRVKAEQERQLEEWKRKQQNKSTRSSAFEAGNVFVYCRVCNYKVCDGTQIIHKGSNYICRDPSLPQKCEIVYKNHPQQYRTTDNIGLVFCGNPTCRNQYGPIIRYKIGQEETAYGMNVKSFLFDCGDGQLRAISKWSKAPFPITEEPYE